MTGLVPITAACILEAASLQQVPPQIILGFLKTEGGQLGSESKNKNGSVDLGPMQINDRVWVPVVADMHFNGNRAEAYAALRDNGCYNVHIGTWIFRGYLDKAGGDYAEAIGHYNSHTPSKKAAYQKRYADNFLKLFGDFIKGN